MSELSQNFVDGPPSFLRATAAPLPTGPPAGPPEPVPLAVVAAVAIVLLKPLPRLSPPPRRGVARRATFRMILRSRRSAGDAQVSRASAALRAGKMYTLNRFFLKYVFIVNIVFNLLISEEMRSELFVVRLIRSYDIQIK